MSTTTVAASPFSARSQAVLVADLDRWVDGRLRGELFLLFLERLAASPLSVLALLDGVYRRDAEACLDTAVEMGLAVVSRPVVGDRVVLASGGVWEVRSVTLGAALVGGFGTALGLRGPRDQVSAVGTSEVVAVVGRAS